MVIGRIKLGANLRLLRKPLSGDLLRGFFYGVVTDLVAVYRVNDLARQHLILQTICRQVVSTVRIWTGRDRLVHPEYLPAPFFYDNPSQKRVARCTNILHTGATLSGVGEGQRLRKGFQKQWRGSLTIIEYSRVERVSITEACFCCRPTACFESLSSAAKLRHSARNTRL